MHQTRIFLFAVALLLYRAELRGGTTTCDERVSFTTNSGTITYVPQSARILRLLEREERVHAELNARFPFALEIRRVAWGSENVVFLVRNSDRNRFAVRAPLGSNMRRSHRTYRAERARIAHATARDPAGGRFLAAVIDVIPPIDDHLPLLYMAYAELGSLQQNLAHFGPANARDHPKRFKRAWMDMSLAVRSLHRGGIVHRDIKPGNFLVHLVDSEYRMALTDLGISTAIGAQPHGREGLLSGTLSHMSENQLRRGNALLTDDLHALKTSFQEMLCGQILWRINASLPENHILLRNLNGFGTYPTLLRLPDSVVAVVPESMRVIAETTYSTIDDVIAAVEGLAY